MLASFYVRNSGNARHNRIVMLGLRLGRDISERFGEKGSVCEPVQGAVLAGRRVPKAASAANVGRCGSLCDSRPERQGLGQSPSKHKSGLAPFSPHE